VNSHHLREKVQTTLPPHNNLKRLFLVCQIFLFSSFMLLNGCNDDSSGSSATTGNSISGVVIDDVVPNAKVSCTLADGTFLFFITTNQNGAFTLPLSNYQSAQLQVNGNVLISAEVVLTIKTVFVKTIVPMFLIIQKLLYKLLKIL